MSQTAFFEQYDRAEEVQPPSGRAFGIAISVLFAIVGFARILHGAGIRWWAVGCSAAFLFTSLCCPSVLSPLAKLATRIMAPVQHAVKIGVMAVLFFLVITPVGLLRGLLLRDPLHLRFDGAAPTYWQTRPPSEAETAGMRNQF